MEKTNVTAIVTPDEHPDQSSFISALRDELKGPKDFLYGGGIPSWSYYNGYIIKPSIKDKLVIRLKKLNFKEYLFEKYLKSQNVNTIIAEYGITAVQLLDICKKLEIKLITHFHGFDAYEYQTLKTFGLHYKEVFNYSSEIIVVSNDMKKKLIQLGAPEEKIIYNPCAPNDNFYSVTPDFTSNQFISIGRFVDKKAPYFTLLSFAKLNKEFPESRLTMIGDGPLLNTCKNICEYLGLSNSVDFKGKLKREKVLEEIQNSFCFIQHSIVAGNGDSEGTPVSVMEAAASGLPVIATYHAGIADVHLDQITALLSPEGDVEQMHLNMRELYLDRELAKEMGKKGRKRIKNNYSMEKYIETIQGLANNS